MRAFLPVSVLLFAASPAAAQAVDPAGMAAAPIPAAEPGEWVLLQYFYPAPRPGRGVDYWISARDYGEGPDAEGIVRVRIVQPRGFNAAAAPTEIVDYVTDVDCVNRRERPIQDGAAGDWQTLPDFVPGSQTIFELCSPNWVASRPHEPDLSAAIAHSRELERLHREKEAMGHY